MKNASPGLNWRQGQDLGILFLETKNNNFGGVKLYSLRILHEKIFASLSFKQRTMLAQSVYRRKYGSELNIY